MNKRVKKLWIKALRSGKYKQGRGHLKSNEEGVSYYCCLGVLCELALKDGVLTDYEGNDSYPSPVVDDWADFEPKRDRLGPRRDSPRAVELNDVKKASFAQIADRIERYL